MPPTFVMPPISLGVHIFIPASSVTNLILFHKWLCLPNGRGYLCPHFILSALHFSINNIIFRNIIFFMQLSITFICSIDYIGTLLRNFCICILLYMHTSVYAYILNTIVSVIRIFTLVTELRVFSMHIQKFYKRAHGALIQWNTYLYVSILKLGSLEFQNMKNK